MDNNCVKYYLDPTWHWGVMARTQIWLCVHYDLDIRDMTLGQGHDTPLDHGQQCCKILFTFYLAVTSYYPDTDFGYVCNLTLTLEIWHWVKVMKHPWIIDNTCVKYYPDPILQWGVFSGYWLSVYVHCDLDLEDLTFGQGHDILQGHGQQLCEILSRSRLQWGVIARTRI